MFSSVGAFLYDLAGIRMAPGVNGFTSAWLWPAVTDHPALGFASGQYNSIAGFYSIAWDVANTVPCEANVPENTQVTLSCTGASNVINNITFASFGTPTGTCGNFAVGSCNAANTTSAIAALCVGQSSCTFDSATTFFGDPCYDTVKILYVYFFIFFSFLIISSSYYLFFFYNTVLLFI
jgi:Galactose binding lectin domain